MSSVLSAIAPTGAPRDALSALLSAGPRTAAPVSRVESASAVRPVEASTEAQNLINQTLREKPVGPPPAFEINVLQDIRTHLTDPAARGAAQDAPPPPPSDEAEDPAAPDPDIDAADAAPEAGHNAPPARPPAVGTGAEPAHLLDMKV